MMKLNFRVILETPAILPKTTKNGEWAFPASALKGIVRSSFRNILNIDQNEEESLFGGAQSPGRISFTDIIFEGTPDIRASRSVSLESLKDFLLAQEIAPVGSSFIGEIRMDDDITEEQLMLVKSAVSRYGFAGVGGGRTRGYGQCKVEFINLKNLGHIFISYSWEDNEHNNWVLSLASRFTKDGIYVNFDRYDLGIGDDIKAWANRIIENADKILIILTPTYKEKADNLKGGVGVEYLLFRQHLEKPDVNNKFLPILRKGDFNLSIPDIFKDFFVCDMRNDSGFQQSYTDLFSAVLGKKPIQEQRPKYRFE